MHLPGALVTTVTAMTPTSTAKGIRVFIAFCYGNLVSRYLLREYVAYSRYFRTHFYFIYIQYLVTLIWLQCCLCLLHYSVCYNYSKLDHWGAIDLASWFSLKGPKYQRSGKPWWKNVGTNTSTKRGTCNILDFSSSGLRNFSMGAGVFEVRPHVKHTDCLLIEQFFGVVSCSI